MSTLHLIQMIKLHKEKIKLTKNKVLSIWITPFLYAFNNLVASGMISFSFDEHFISTLPGV